MKNTNYEFYQQQQLLLLFQLLCFLFQKAGRKGCCCLEIIPAHTFTDFPSPAEIKSRRGSFFTQ